MVAVEKTGSNKITPDAITLTPDAKATPTPLDTIESIAASVNPAVLKGQRDTASNALKFAMSRMTAALILALESYKPGEADGLRALTQEYVIGHNRLGAQFWERWKNACKQASRLAQFREMGVKSKAGVISSLTVTKGPEDERKTFILSRDTNLADWDHGACTMSAFYGVMRKILKEADPKAAEKAKAKAFNAVAEALELDHLTPDQAAKLERAILKMAAKAASDSAADTD